MVKIIFFDIDGTLIDIDADDMSDKTKYALQKLKENKILIFFYYKTHQTTFYIIK